VFETALLNQRRQSRRTLVFVAAIGAHAVLLGGVVAAQYWKVDAVVEPPMSDVFHVALLVPPPPKAEIQKKQTAAPPQKHDVVPPTPTPAVNPSTAVQPDKVPDEIPPTPAVADSGADLPTNGTAGNTRGSGSSDGVDFSIGDGNDAPIQIGQGITAPVTLSRVSPLYTESARRARIQGVVILEAVIDREGNVGEIKVLKGLGFGLDENATNAVARWRFKPAHTGDGRAVSVYFRLTVDYHLN